jgi:hypothetical protein
MKEKLIEILKVFSYYPRKIIDAMLFHFYFKNKNDWTLLKKFANKPVLIVGNGPSLNKTPLEKISKSSVSIGMNKINLIYEKSAWRPDIITCVNGFVIRQNKKYFNTTKRILILPIRALYLGIKPRKNILFVNLKYQYKIEKNIENVLSTGCTVTFTALQIAAYLNPKCVNIVGVDHSFVVEKTTVSAAESKLRSTTNAGVQKFNGDDVNHFSKEYFKNQFWGLPDLGGSEVLYQIAKDYFDLNQIPIIDYTVDGKLKVFKKENINAIIANANSKYKESISL